MTIEEMNLDPTVEAKARTLKHLCPNVVFLSGRRDLAAQARAMGQNVARVRSYIRDTYAASPVRHALQEWVDAHPLARNAELIAAGLLKVLQSLPEGEVEAISRHLVGMAFDIAPGTATEGAILALKPRKFLRSEAGLVRLHVEF